MASINGISLRGVKSFLDHEGATIYQGTLCLNGKKVGFWSQDAWGGRDLLDFDPKYSEALLNQLIRKLNPDKVYPGPIEYDLDLLLFDFLGLWRDEKVYKKAVKAGYAGVLIMTDGYHITTWKLPESYAKMSDKALLKKMEPAIAEEKKGFFNEIGDQKNIIKIYRSLDDFIIGEQIKFKDILAES